MSENRKYDREFKLEAVKLVVEGGRKISEISQNLGIHENLLRAWKKKYLEDGLNAFPGKGNLKPDEAEMMRLRRKLKDAEEERDILKKAVAIFSKASKRNISS